MVVNRKQVDVTVSSFVPAVLECANCSLHPTAEGALSAVSLSTVPRLSCCPGSPVVCEWGSERVGKAGGVTNSDSPCVHVGSNDVAF